MSKHKYAPVVYLRDVDGSGSLHPCSKGDPGALAYVPAMSKDEVEEIDLWPTNQKLSVDFQNL